MTMTKHIEIHMHYIIEMVHDRIIDLQYCPSSKHTANIFTKTFTEQKFHLFVQSSWSEGHSFLATTFFLLLFDALYFEGGGGFP
jgi:hypothetical protein